MIIFHRVLISIATVFCAGMSWWSYEAYRQGGGGVQLAMVLAFLAATIGLAYYLRHLDRFLHPGGMR